MWWIILLFLVFGNGYGGYGNRQGGGSGGDALYPWMNQAQNNWEGVSTLQNSICGLGQTMQNGFAQAEIAANSRQMADMNQNFALQSQLAQCCCENRLATANLNSTIISENCADRQAVNDVGRDLAAQSATNTNALLNAINGGIQSIKDQICADKIDAKNDEIAQLRQRLYMSDLAASQNAQTAMIQAGQRALANEVEQYVLPTPRPAYIVQNPNCCAQNYGCGCGNGFAN
jgi:hypothetical protein